MFEREASQSLARNACLANPQGRELRQRFDRFDHRIVEWTIGVGGSREYKCLAVRRDGEQAHGGLEEEDRLIVPEPPVDINLFDMRKGRETAQLIFERKTPLRDAREIERMDLEIGGGKLGKIGD